MKISYYLNSERKKNLYCRISDGKHRNTFSLGHYVDPDTWDSKREDIKWNNQFSGALNSLKEILTNQYHSIKNNDPKAKIEILKNEALSHLGNNGLESLQKNLWNKKAGNSLASYDDFITAIEKYSGFKRSLLKISILEYSMNFITPDGKHFVVDTYLGHSLYLKDLISSRDYESINIQTWPELWHKVYVSDGIKKSSFLPQFLYEWEKFWNYKKINIPSPTHYEKLKKESWNRFIVFMSCYNDGDPFELASNLDDYEFIPLFVITMLNIFDMETCIDEYCEYYFTNEIWDWEDFDLSEGEEDLEEKLSNSIFYFREEEI